MKNFKIAAVLSLISLSLSAQKIIEKNIEYKNQNIDVEVKFASDIQLKTWDNPTIYLKADINTTDGKYLDSYTLNVEERNSTIYIVSKAEPVFKKFQEEWSKNNPDKKKRHYNSGCYEYEFNYVLYIPKNAKCKLSSINGNLKSEVIEGDFTADLINGDIDIKKYAGNLELRTINGEIDLPMRNTKLEAETIHGEIYADGKLKFTSTDRHVGQKIEGSFDNPTNRLLLNTINGNMYLR